ncbi:MAG: YcbK family protein [Methylophagaceae bacterium]
MTFRTNLQHEPSVNIATSRRRFLQFGLGLTASLAAAPSAFANTLQQPDRKLSLLNLHTGESIDATYWTEGEYQTNELAAINSVLRDHRTGDVEAIDQNLIELLNLLHTKVDSSQPFHVISGYRSPKSNAALRENSNGVAKKSFHMKGMAIDIRLPKCQLSSLHEAAVNLEIGGVGRYSKSDFIHIDTGTVRQWGS